MATSAIVFPESQQFVGWGRELVVGTLVPAGMTIPVEKPEPDDKPQMLPDTGLRGDMNADHGLIQGNEIAEFDLSGDVYLDSFPFILHNLMGDYTTTGSTPTNSTTLSGGVAAGATSLTVVSGTGYSIGQAVQIGTAVTPEIVVLTAVASNTLTFTNTPLRWAHLTGVTVATVVAPFTHVFSTLNTGTGQPVTHTLTHRQGITATSGARQYGFWCASDCDMSMSAEQLFTHATKGTSLIGVAAGSAPANNGSLIAAQPNWRFTVGIGGPATGGTQATNITDAGVTISRGVKPRFTLDGTQGPLVIARDSLAVNGKFTFLAQDESPLLALLANSQPILQLAMTNSLSGANLLAVTFDIQVGAYETTKLAADGELMYETTWRAITNPTNAGGSGAGAPAKITIQNAVPTY